MYSLAITLRKDLTVKKEVSLCKFGHQNECESSLRRKLARQAKDHSCELHEGPIAKLNSLN